MELSQLHFAHSLWLWAIIVVPIIWALYYHFYQNNNNRHQLEKFIDRHLLPYLLVPKQQIQASLWKPLCLWSVVWICLIFALAGPRWSFKEIETFSRNQSLVILLDLSESMNTRDIKPSRLVRAKQKIEDILENAQDTKIGLIAFAADPHIIAPITDDKETIRYLLPTLSTDLVYVQGSKLSSALEMASNLLAGEPGQNKSLLVISDGGFEDANAIKEAKRMAEKDIRIYAMGVGTNEGAPLRDSKGNIIKKNGIVVVSKLDHERLSEISYFGKGRYLEAGYADQAEMTLLQDLEKRAELHEAHSKKNQLWDEQFYWLLIPILPIILWWFRTGALFVAIIIFSFPLFELKAAPFEAYFQNSEERGKQALEEGCHTDAIAAFQDPYRKGVAQYKAGNFADAEKSFRHSTRAEVAPQAAYNLGNCLAQQKKWQEAMAAYEEVLKKWPDHTKAKENLEIIKKMLEQQPDSSPSDNSEGEQNQNSDKNNTEKNNSQNQTSNEQKKSESEQKSSEENQKDQKQNPKESENQQNSSEENQKNQEQNQPSKESENEQNSSKENAGQKDLTNKSAEKDVSELNEKQNQESRQNEHEEIQDSQSEQNRDADMWLNRIVHDPKKFMQNKFYIESTKSGAKEGIDPW